MDFKKSLKDVVVLVVICAVFATILAFTNSITAPIIAERLEGAANQAYEAVMPGATGFEDVDLTGKTLPATVVEAKRETSGMGYAIKLETKGYATGMIIIVGVDTNGVVTGATCIASNETWGLEKTFGDKTVGKDINTIVDVEAGATSYTVNGYRAAVKDAINAAIVLGGGSADIRDDAEILADNLDATLPAGNGEFDKMLIVEIIEGVDKIYAAKNGAGYVLVVDDMFVGVGTDGLATSVVDAKTNPVTEGIDEVKATAEAAAAVIAATELTDVDASAFEGIHSRIKSIQVTATGNYVFVIESEGHGIKGDEHAYPSGKPSVIQVSISAEGVVIDAQTLENHETETWGGPQLNDGAYNSNFIGKTQTEANGVDTVADSTNTTRGYKQAVLRCFEAFNIIVGGAN